MIRTPMTHVPKTRAPKTRFRCRRAAAAGLIAALAGSCAQLEGDFARPRPNVIRDDVLPVAGGAFASVRGEPVSLVAMTDDERQLRDRAYAYLAPPEGFKFLSLPVAELRAPRILPNNGPLEPAPGLYTQALLAYQYRSTTARWQRLIDDIRSDRDRIGAFVRVAAHVAEMDRVRTESFRFVQAVSDMQREQVMARVEENKMLIDAVRSALAQRIAIYRDAMENLLVAQPAPVAMEAERALKSLQERAADPVLALAAQPLPAIPPPENKGYFPGSDKARVRKD
ncbi:hypothetical protein [Blastochloris sulfoviridis]|uniref:Uncharacterized protein n=1 Tax=Blastochloris sulfoviridis TaxID=50712 RepID=A0A5M6I3U2_9HYPH|nr:hypothetical protein [Blastochloris sulfoviridis]KAA5602843.1 hypothetical protein F1193_03115 [Blastochloris sulfoviridis]